MEDNAKIEKGILYAKEKVSETLDPLVKEWFFAKFKDFSIPQLYGVIPIYHRKNILVSAPTGGTKTLTAFLSIINYLVKLGRKNELEDKIYSVYVSPLKALNNDIYFNLTKPLQEISELSEKKGIKLQKIRIGLRTGDTTTKDKAQMLKNSPHILITTPESLAIVLSSVKFVEHLHAVEFVIIDEIHAMANKRGVHLSISLERLKHMSKITPVRIGLSATISPLQEIAKFLIGSEKQCILIDIQFNKKNDIRVLTAADNLIDSDVKKLHNSLYGLIDKLVEEHKTTLIFTNTRAATERVIHHLKEMFPGKYLNDIGAHHSSLSKSSRFSIEEKLRKGQLKVVVTSTSLELGIDIGYIDLVILLGSPKSVARSLQRIGRAGHKLHDIAKGRFIVMDRDDLVECCVIQKQGIEKHIDKVQIPKNCLDVLSQHIYGMAIYKQWDIDELLNVIKGSYCYKNLKKEDFLSVISYLTGEYSLEDRHVYAKIWYDPETRVIGKRGKLARVIYMTNIGTIPDESFVEVVLGRGERIGESIGKIDESFLERMKKGDVFVLGGNRYMFLYSRGMKAYVSGSVNRPPTIPSWFSEMLPLSFDLALEIQRFRKLMNEKFKNKVKKQEILNFIQKHLYCKENIAESIYNYFNEQFNYLEIPHQENLIIEEYKGEKRYFIFHTLFGRRVNDALSRAVAFICAKLGNRDVEIGITDNGFYLSGEKINLDKALKYLKSKDLDEILKHAVEKTEVLNRRFRHCAARSLMILRSYKGIRKSVGKQQMKSWFLMSSVRKLSDKFPILQEARREVLEDLMDIENAKKVVAWIEENKVKIKRVKTTLPSPFALNIVMQGYFDLIKIEDKIAFLKRMHEIHVKEIK